MMHNAQTTKTTSERIVEAATTLFYGEGIRNVSVDAVAEKANVTKRTIYYHFKSKANLVAAYLKAQNKQSLALLSHWYENSDGNVAEKIEHLFHRAAKNAGRPKWNGCGFLRSSAELASNPKHPALQVSAAHKKQFEAWLENMISTEGIYDSAVLARQVVLLWDGAFSIMLIHRDPVYIETAGKAAAALIRPHLKLVED